MCKKELVEKLPNCDCWACKNARAGGGYQPCHKTAKRSKAGSPPKKP